MEKIKILFVEDNVETAGLIYDYLSSFDFTLDVVHTATDGISYIENNDYDLLLLDLNLPDFNGMELIKKIKNRVALPIIVMSADSNTQSKVRAFKYGASDYMVKPIDLEELDARIWALLGRYSNIKIAEEKKEFRIEESTIYFKSKALHLTTIEYEILSELIQNEGRVLSRGHLVEALSSISTPRSLDNHIKSLRKKIGDDARKTQYIKTEYGLGYRLDYK